MTELLLASPLLTIMVVVALGAAVGMIRFGSLRFGAAGALFVGLAIGAIDPALGEGLGLALFVYCVGLSAGATLFQNLRRKAGLLGLGVAVAVAVVTRLWATPWGIRWG